MMVYQLLVLLVILPMHRAINTTCAPQSPVIQTTLGAVCGNALPSGATEFLGIPYAEAPTGNLRWASPVPPAPWSRTRSGQQYGPGCLQLHHNPDVPHPQSEDCLNLNLYLPDVKTCSGGPYATMIWFHGGSFEEGGSSLF